MQTLASADERDDAQLALAARGGDVDAVVRLLRRHEQLLRRVIRRTLDGRHDVDDVLQETALQVWQSIETLREPGAVRAWMVRIARNNAIRSATQNRSKDELSDEMVLVDGPDAGVERFDLHRDLTDALSHLSLLQAQAWRLREIDGQSYREIAGGLGVAESTVRGALATARQRVQETMSKSCPKARLEHDRLDLRPRGAALVTDSGPHV